MNFLVGFVGLQALCSSLFFLVSYFGFCFVKQVLADGETQTVIVLPDDVVAVKMSDLPSLSERLVDGSLREFDIPDGHAFVMMKGYTARLKNHDGDGRKGGEH